MTRNEAQNNVIVNINHLGSFGPEMECVHGNAIYVAPKNYKYQFAGIKNFG
jgi:hypothetical protein